jgi:hypothetical protein
MNLQTETVIAGGDTTSNSTTQLHRIGTRMVTRDGRVFRYAQVGAVDLVAGNVIQGPAITPNHLANTPPVVPVGATSFTYTPGATLGTVNQYADGWLQVDTTPGNGVTYGIDSHLAFASATAFTLNLRPDDPITVALTAASRVGLIANPYRGVIQMPVTTATGSLVGVAPGVISAASFGWLQTWGVYAGVLINGTPALGSAVVGVSATTAGSVDIAAAATLITGQILGTMVQVGVSTKNNAVFLRITP